jgi:hypothetical protein
MMLFRFGGTDKDGGTAASAAFGCAARSWTSAAKGTEQPRLPSHFQQSSLQALDM